MSTEFNNRFRSHGSFLIAATITLLIAAFLLTHFSINQLWLFIKISFFLGLLTLSGSAVLLALFKNLGWGLLVGGGMILGPLLQLTILSIISYIFKGPLVILIAFFAQVVGTLYITEECYRVRNKSLLSEYKDKRSKLIALVASPFAYLLVILNKISKLEIRNRGDGAVVIIALVHIFLIFTLAGNAPIGGDIDIHWGIANSFSRGNYPTVLPWQSQFLTVYHEGTFIVLGALRTLSSGYIAPVHVFLSSFFLTAIFIFLVGWAREKTKSILCVLPAVFSLFFFGMPIFPINNLFGFLAKFIELTPNNFFNWLSQQPTYYDFYQFGGGGASSLEGLIYIIYISQGLGVFFLFLFFLLRRNKSSLKDYLILSLIMVLNLSVDETFFPIEISLLVFYFLKDYSRKSFKQIISSVMVVFLCLLLLFLTFQNPVRDSLFVPSETPRFKILPPSDQFVKNRLSYIFSQNYILKDNQFGWYLMDIWIVVLIVLTVGLVLKEEKILLLGSSSLLSLPLSIFVVNTFWLPNNGRFFNQSYELEATAIGFVLISIFSRRFKYKKVLFLLLITVLLPQFLVTYSKIIQKSQIPYMTNYNIAPRVTALEKIAQKYPLESHIIFPLFKQNGFIEGYLSSLAIKEYGIFVPIGPPDIKELNPWPSLEWLDSMFDLNPPSLKSLNVDYIFLLKSSLASLPPGIMERIKNPEYFELVEDLEIGYLLKVKDGYKNLGNNELSFEKIIETIGRNKTVYLSNKVDGLLHGGLVLNLAKQNKIIVPYPLSIGGNYYLYIETQSPVSVIPNMKNNLKENNGLSYALFPPNVNPLIKLSGNFVKEIEILPYVVLWKKANN